MRRKHSSARRWPSVACAIVFQICACALLAQDQKIIRELRQSLAAADSTHIEAIDKELLSGTPDLETLLTAGSLLGEANQLEQSKTIFAGAVHRFPNSFEARYNWALALLALNQAGAASAALENAQPTSEVEQTALGYLRGKIILSSGDLKAARSLLEDAYRAHPEEENYALDLGLLYIRSAEYLPAIDILRAASQIHPASSEMKMEWALADALAGRESEAISLTRALTDDDSTGSLANLIAAFAYCMKGDYQACKDDAARGLRSAHPHPYLNYLHASAVWNLTPESRAPLLADLNTALSKLPACAVCLQLRSRVFESMQDNAAAITDMQTLLRQDPQNAAAWYRLSLLWKKAGEKRRQAEALQRYQAIHTTQADSEKEGFRDLFLQTAAGAPSKQ